MCCHGTEIFGRTSVLVRPRRPKLWLRPNIIRACSVHVYFVVETASSVAHNLSSLCLKLLTDIADATESERLLQRLVLLPKTVFT